MATKFVFEELDEATRDYLTAVRDAEGMGSPGVFVSTTDSLPGCGCIAGPILVILTLVLSLTTIGPTWLPNIGAEPVGLALFQAGGLLLGGWLLVAGLRGSKGTRKMAGNWIYVDPLYLYEAFREQVTVTAIDDIDGANFTHNYNNGAYQNSVVRLESGGTFVAAVTIANEARAEQMVVYLNYLAWARGPEGGARADLAPATLGGLAKYVAKNDHEPLDAENNLNYNQIELDITDVPEEPTRAGRAVPAFFPYLVMLGFAGLVFVLMGFVINPPLRDETIYQDVIKEPYVQPVRLRYYLADPRNKLHREQVTARLSRCYEQPILHVEKNGGDPVLKAGMMEVLKSVRTAEQPVVSIRATEKGTPAGKEGSKSARETELRTKFVDGLAGEQGEFVKPDWGAKIKYPDGSTSLAPVGSQLLEFVDAPDGAERVHFDFVYTITAKDNGTYLVALDVTIRVSIEDANPTAQTNVVVAGTFTARDFESPTAPAVQPGTTPSPAPVSPVIARISADLVKAMVGLSNPGVMMPGGMNPIPIPINPP